MSSKQQKVEELGTVFSDNLRQLRLVVSIMHEGKLLIEAVTRSLHIILFMKMAVSMALDFKEAKLAFDDINKNSIN